MNGETDREPKPLRRGWTTGACATAATKSALTALLSGNFLDPVTITLPKGEAPSFVLAREQSGEGWAKASIIKDAGDDPDVTHGAEITSKVQFAKAGSGVTFRAGTGVGRVTKAGLPLPVGEAAINPVPRKMMVDVVTEVAANHGVAPDIEIEISVADGEKLAEKTWNPRLGIIGGLSILGTTGIVHPFSCSAWIHSIYRGIDVARAEGLPHILGSTGSTSEQVAQALLGLPDGALIDMGDFVGGMLKYVRNHPVPKVTIAGGFAKITKLAQGSRDLHSARSTVNFEHLASLLKDLGGDDEIVARAMFANTAMEVLSLADEGGFKLPKVIAALAKSEAQTILGDADSEVSVLIVDRAGKIRAHV